MANFFNILNKKIIISTGRLSSSSSKDAISLNSERVYSDLAKITSYHNEVIYEAFRKLCSKPQFPYDVVESGISGNTVVTYLEEDGNSENNSALYWNTNNNRPNTVKESFDYLLANLGVSQIVRETVQPDLENITNIIRCNTNNLDKLRKDIVGCKYVFDCTDTETYRWSLSKHIYELFRQDLILGHVPAELDNLNSTCGDFDYPDLSLKVLTSDIQEGATLIPQNLVAGCSTTLESQLDKIQNFIGMSSCEETLNELSESCSTYGLPQGSRNLKEYIKKIIDRLCGLPEGQGIDAVYLGVKDPAIGEDRNIEGISEDNYNPLKTGSSLVYYHSSELENKKHWFKLNGDESFIEGLFVPDSYVKTPDWTTVDYTNPIPYTLFTYASNPNLHIDYVNQLRGLTTYKRVINKLNSICLFEEICSYEQQTEQKYKYEQIGGVIRNDLTIADRGLDTGSNFLKYTDSLENYHINSGTEDYKNHLQVSGHTPVICIGPVDFGDVLIPAPLRLQKVVIQGDDRNYGFVCSRKLLEESFIADTLYQGNTSDLNYKVGISLSSNKDLIQGNTLGNSVLALTYHQDVLDNIVLKAKPGLTVQRSPDYFGAIAYAYLSIQYMRIML